MASKRIALVSGVFLVSVLIFQSGCTSVSASSVGTKYYVDCLTGSDTNPGTSENKAWKSLEKVNSVTFTGGDEILLKADGFWTGQLWPKGSGELNNPIKVDMYGQGAKPIIAGAGKVRDAVKLFNQEYWEISNLDISNFKGGDPNMKNGVYVAAEDYGTVHHIHLKNLYIHNVNGDITDKFNGGIFFDALGSVKPTSFDDFLIDGCELYDIDRTGISNNSVWEWRAGSDLVWTPSTRVIIRNNIMERSGANGLIIRATDNAIIERNTFKECSLKTSGNTALPFNCDNTIFQYNESYLAKFNPGDVDGGGFDSDYGCRNSVFQYNYSHDNDYGFMLICCYGGVKTRAVGFNEGTIIRYNISQNDNGFIFRLAGIPKNTYIYNNTIYIGRNMFNAKYDKKDNAIPKVFYNRNWGGWADSTFVYNNIFYVDSNSVIYHFGESTNNVFNSNAFFGYHPPTEPNDPNKITADPMLVEPGSGGIGMNTLDGYKLKDGSPCIDAGMVIENNGGKDYWGNPLYNGKPDIGAFEKPK